MTEKDEVKPFHAKEVASGQEAADAVAAVLKHAQERDAAAKQKTGPKKQPRWLLPLGINLAVFAAYLLIASPNWVVINRIEPPPSEERVDRAAGGVYFAAGKVESFRVQNGRLPSSLEEAGVGAAGLEYVVQGTGNYVLFLTVGEREITYRSAQQSLNEWAAQNVQGMQQRIGG